MSAIDEAFKRYEILSRLIALEQERARANPLHQRYIDLGVVKVGDSKIDAVQKVGEVFDALARFLEHVAILDMTGSFENFSRRRVGSAIGTTRTLIKDDTDKNRRNKFGVKLVKSLEDFEGLSDILALVEGSVPARIFDALVLARKSRNAFAHGTNVNIAPAIEPAQARKNLNEIASLF